MFYDRGDLKMKKKHFFRELVKTIWHKWWFLTIALLAQLIPPYTSGSFQFAGMRTVNAYILTHPIKGNFAAIFPIFQILPVLVLIAIFLGGREAAPFFSGYGFFCYVIIPFMQNTSISESYGVAVATGNMLVFLLLAGMWLWETIELENDFTPKRLPVWKYWPFLFAFFAFWEPLHPQALMTDFNLHHLLTSGSGLSFCMITPLFLAVLITHFPDVNKTVLIATSFVGFIMALGNFYLEFVLVPSSWWTGVLHIPLFILSSYGIILSFTEQYQITKSIIAENEN